MTVSHPQWGVRLERVGGAIVVAPSGALGGAEAERLRRVLHSREGAYACLVIDLRDLVSIDADGVDVLVEQFEHSDRQKHDIAFVAGPAAEAALQAAGLADRLPLHGDIEEVLAPHRRTWRG